MFTADNDSYDAQKAQHEILKDLVRDEDLLANFQSGELEQVEPILCTNTGVVVNGNRRLCAWRMLFYADKIKYKTFETIHIAVLPEMDEKGILDLEKKLQILKPMRAEYRWHTKALMAESDLKNGQKDTEVAKSYDMTKKKLFELIDALHIAELYLEEINHPNEWSRLDKSQYAFDSIVTGGKKILDPNKKELFQKLAFDLITKNLNTPDGASGDRLYNKIKEYADNIDAIAVEMAKKLASQNEESSQTQAEDSSTQHHINEPPTRQPENNQNNDELSLLAGGEVITPDAAGIASSAIDKGAEIRHDQIGEIIDAQKALRGEKDKARFLISQLSKVISTLDFAINNGLDAKTNTNGVPNQLEEIQKRVEKIKNWLSTRQ